MASVDDSRVMNLIKAQQSLNVSKTSSTMQKSNKAVSKSKDAQEISNNMSSAEIKEEIEKLQKEKELNLKKMERVEAEMHQLAEDARDNIIEAAKKQEKAISEHEDEAKEVLDREIKKYIEANKNGEEGMSKAKLQSNIQNSMPNAPHLAQALAKLTEANEQIAQIDCLLGSLNILINDVEILEFDINTKTSQYEAAVSAERAKSCDPIGFTLDQANGKVRYDFIIDDGSFDSTNDFLGAQNQWAEMEALDISGDGVVSADELSKKNIKAVKTNPDGSREVVDIAKEFGSDFSVDLTSYKTGGSHSSINTSLDSDNDGVKDQRLLGTFDVNLNNQKVKGYNTLDDVDYLEEKYDVLADATSEQYSEELIGHVNFFEEYSLKNDELKQNLITGYKSLDLSEDFIKLINKESQTEASKKANIFMEKIEKELAQEQAQEAKEVKEAEEEENVQEVEEDSEDSTINFKTEDISAMSLGDLKKYLQKIEEAAQEGNQEAIIALNNISEEAIDKIVEKITNSASSNVIISKKSVENSANQVKESLQNLKSVYPA